MDILALVAQLPAGTGSGALRLFVTLSLISGAGQPISDHQLEALFTKADRAEGAQAEALVALEAWRGFCERFQPASDLDLDALLDEQYGR